MTEAAGRSTPLRRRLLFAGLYFSEGAPIGFVWWALPVWLRAEGATPGQIARLMAWVAWPWALKFLWAPLVDLVGTHRFGLRGWILSSQAAMALTLAPLLFIEVGAGGDLLLAVLLLHALAAATQDAAIDTLAVRSVPVDERGAVNGWMQVGMLAARALFGGGAVLLAARIGERGVVLVLIAAVLIPGLLGASRVPAPAGEVPPRAVRLEAYRRAGAQMLRRRGLWAGLLYAAVAGAGFEGLASLAGPLLMDRGASQDMVGVFFLVPCVAAMATGALAGGWASDRFGRRLTTLLGEGAAALAALAIGAAAWVLPLSAGHVPFALLLVLLYFAAGAATAALYGLLMDLCHPDLAATQFCSFMAAINLCYVWATALLGVLVDRLGYGPATVVLGSISLVALPLVALLRPEVDPAAAART